jgi:predicted AAA+ superfamily ATPase
MMTSRSSLLYRELYMHQLNHDLNKTKVLALLGPRQSGKTTLAKQLIAELSEPIHYFDLENPRDLNALSEAQLVFEPLNGLIVIDEIQRKPNLFSLMRYLIDTHQKRFLILGSASKDLLRQSSESLAGRIRYREISPFSLKELPNSSDTFLKLWLRGGFPSAYLEKNDEDAFQWLKDFIKTYLEDDIRRLGLNLDPTHLRRFWMLLTHYHGQIFNAAELSRGLQMSNKTVHHYLDIMHSTFMVRILQPWYVNISKRQVRSPKIYLRDSGIYHTFLNIPDYSSLQFHPKLGASFEGFALEEVIRKHQADPQDCFFWSTHSGAELDLILFPDTKKLAFEFKYTSEPKVTKSMLQVISDLSLDQLLVIIPGSGDYQLNRQIRVVGLQKYLFDF